LAFLKVRILLKYTIRLFASAEAFQQKHAAHKSQKCTTKSILNLKTTVSDFIACCQYPVIQKCKTKKLNTADSLEVQSIMHQNPRKCGKH
jgi:hypothetical protein